MNYFKIICNRLICKTEFKYQPIYDRLMQISDLNLSQLPYQVTPLNAQLELILKQNDINLSSKTISTLLTEAIIKDNFDATQEYCDDLIILFNNYCKYCDVEPLKYADFKEYLANKKLDLTKINDLNCTYKPLKYLSDDLTSVKFIIVRDDNSNFKQSAIYSQQINYSIINDGGNKYHKLINDKLNDVNYFYNKDTDFAKIIPNLKLKRTFIRPNNYIYDKLIYELIYSNIFKKEV